MKQITGIILFLLLASCIWAQKNVVAVTHTRSLALGLPAGSKEDKRFISRSAAQVLLELESKNAGVAIQSVEVYSLPSVSVSGYNSDSLVQALGAAGFQLAGVEGDDKYAWAVTNGKAYLIYFETGSRESNLYIGQCSSMPAGFSDSPATETTQGSGQSQPVPPPANTLTEPQAPAIPPSSYPGSFQFNTSNFDDGWVAVIQQDWVLVQKSNAAVYLYYAVPYNSDHFSGTGVMERDYYWDNYVARQFNVSSKQYNDNGEFISSMKPKYVEGWGTDRQTGQQRFIAMTLTIAPNAAQLTVASYPDENSYRNAFPKANDKFSSDLVAMHRYNKFALGRADLGGSWQSGGSQMVQWYNAITGAYAGATFASSSATFHFQPNGTYTSIHNGATGAVGAMNSFQQEYRGTYTVSNWKVEATNRYQGKTEQFEAHFQAVRGGRLLYLNDQKGGQYLLVKIK